MLLSFRRDARRSADSFGKFKTRTRSLSSFWEKSFRTSAQSSGKMCYQYSQCFLIHPHCCCFVFCAFCMLYEVQNFFLDRLLSYLNLQGKRAWQRWKLHCGFLQLCIHHKCSKKTSGLFKHILLVAICITYKFLIVILISCYRGLTSPDLPGTPCILCSFSRFRPIVRGYLCPSKPN